MVQHEKRAKFMYMSNNSFAWCQIDIMKCGDQNIVVFTEMNCNKGPSVTNAIEDILNTFFETMPVTYRADNTTFIERYENRPKELDRVEFHVGENGKVGRADWRRMSGDLCEGILAAMDAADTCKGK